MKAHQLHGKFVANAILSSVDPENFAPIRLTTRALSDDSCWEENESDFDEVLPCYVLNGMDDDF